MKKTNKLKKNKLCLWRKPSVCMYVDDIRSSFWNENLRQNLAVVCFSCSF